MCLHKEQVTYLSKTQFPYLKSEIDGSTLGA